jgi:hypothetical protein
MEMDDWAMWSLMTVVSVRSEIRASALRNQQQVWCANSVVVRHQFSSQQIYWGCSSA